MPGQSYPSTRREAMQAEMDAHAATRPEQAFTSSYPGERQRDDEHAWILTYLDVLTLVIVVFVIMLAFMEPRDPRPHAATTDPIQLIHPDFPVLVEPLTAPGREGHEDRTAADPDSIDEPTPEDREATEQTLAAYKARAPAGVEVVEQPGRVELRIQDDILFTTGAADLQAPGRRLLDELYPLLAEYPGIVTVEGHTDSIPIATERFPSNWELSAARASGVVRYLIDRGLDAAQLRAVGLADTRPVVDNTTPEGRTANRRVSLMLETEASPAPELVP